MNRAGPRNSNTRTSPTPSPAKGKFSATSVNPIDLKMRSGEAKGRFPVQFPGIIGRDVAGIARTLGAKVTGFAPGDKVIAFAGATYAELVVVKATSLTHLPEGLDLIAAAALPLVTLTGEQLISRGTKIQPGQTVLVTGALGSVGRSAVFTAKKAGAKVIAGVRKKQLNEAAALGADDILALDDEAAMEKLGFLDAVADTVGHDTAEKLLAKVKQGGVFASVLGPPANAKMHPTIHIEPVRVVPDAAMLRTLAEDALAGRFKIPIDRMVPLEKAAEAQEAAEKGSIGKVLLLA